VTKTVPELSLGQKQELFMKLLGIFIPWIHTHPTWRVRMQEGYVGITDAADGDYDGPHMQGGAHYNKIGLDIAFFLLEPGKEIQLTTWHPVWDEAGTFWKSLHPLCRWGGDFQSKDFNHFSLYHAGKE